VHSTWRIPAELDKNNTMLRQLFFLVLASSMVVACGNKRVGVPGIDDEASGSDSDVAGAIVETFADALTVVAGNQARIRCIVSRDRHHIEDAPVGVTVDPEIEEVTIEGFTVTFTPTKIGTHAINCYVPDSEIKDDVGLTLRVVSGEPTIVDTVLDASSAVAGMYVDGRCLLFDEFENPILFSDLESGAALPTLVMDESISMNSQNELGYTIRGTTAGDHTVACQYGEVVDDTPAPFEVVPGPPSRTQTYLNPETVYATEPVGVSCSVYDAFDNQLSGYVTTYQVISENGSQPNENGLVQNPSEFTVAELGEYYVFCLVPGHSAGDETPAVATVNAGYAFHWEVEVSQQECYWQDVAFPVSYDVVDRWGNVIENPTIDVLVVPNTGFTTATDGSLIFTQEGDYDITLSLGGTIDPLSVAEPVYFNVRVDSTPPQFQFETPDRGATLEAGTTEDMLVDVSGTVSDGLSPIAVAMVSSQPLDVAGDTLSEEFSLQTNSRWGMTVVSAYAEDECGNRQNAAHSFLRSGSYLEPALVSEPQARVQTGLVAHLNQMALDDGYRLDVDDLATLMQTVLATVDLSTSIPEELIFTGANDGSGNLTTTTYDCNGTPTTNETTGFWAKLNGTFQYGSPAIESLQAVDDGLNLKATIDDIVVPLQIHAAIDLECSGAIVETITGEVRIARLAIEGTASSSFENQIPSITFCETCVQVDFEDITMDFEWGSFAFMGDSINELGNDILVVLEEPLETVLGGLVREQLGDAVSGFLNDIQVGQSFDLPEPISMSLEFVTGLDYLDFSGPVTAGFAELGLYTQVFPTTRGSSIPADSKGAISRPMTLPHFSPVYPFGVGLSDNTLNQVFWALWYGGALSIDDLSALAADVGVDGIEFSFNATMPPVIMPGRNGNEVELGLGDAFISASVNLGQAMGGSTSSEVQAIEVDMYLSTIIGTEITQADDTNGLRLVFDPNPEVWIEITDINYSGYQAEMTDLFTSLMRLMVPKLLGDALKSIPLPAFNVSELIGLEGDVLWEVDGDSVSRNQDYYRITGGFQ